MLRGGFDPIRLEIEALLSTPYWTDFYMSNGLTPKSSSAAVPDAMGMSMGPQHPSMHGVLRLILTLDGENVLDCEPVLGYLHRGMEKIAEGRTVIQYLPYVTRWDYLATMFAEAITVNAAERLANIQVPTRGSYIRMIMLELSRIASHLLWLGPFLADIGAQTPFFLHLTGKRDDL